MRNALAQSLNIPAVKTLYLSGVDEAVKLARDAGINTLTNPDRLGLTLVLGGGEVKLLELVASYGAFATEGVSREPIAILRVEDRNGNVLKEYQPSESRAFSQETATRVSDILSDNRARTPLYGSNSLLYFGGRDVAAKTGTTNDYRDARTLGYTPQLVTGVWVGNTDNSKMDNLPGLRGAGPMPKLLVTPPPDLTRIAARYGGTFPRAGIAWKIDGRDPILSHGGDMPLFGFVFSDMTEVLRSPGGQTVLTSPEVIDLLAYLESVQE